MPDVQKDLVLNPNEYAYILDRTKGAVVCHCGPTKTSLSNTDAPVNFSIRSKKFEECTVEDSVHLFVTAPENWYCVLKNPAPDGGHPVPRSVNDLPPLIIGKKVNINGPATFALFPGQMARVIQGHRLRSNQYLLVRVYDEDAARENWANSVIKTIDPSTTTNSDTGDENNAAPEEAATPSINAVSTDTLTVGKIMVIKGTEVSFYIPPTGIEVVPVEGSDEYIREAVTLERLEYCILKDENGNKRYVHGPAVVFPEPTEAFVPSQDGYKFRAIELSEISGIYVKVIAEYDEKGVHHDVGEEMFITGKDAMIYYPRPEHAIVTYGTNTTLHHAIAIPAGEGRYVMDRMTGKISMVKGPSMFLPDPRKEVIVKRKLTKSQAALWYPGNDEVQAYNATLGEDLEAMAFTPSDPFTGMATKRGDIYPGSMLNRSNKYTPPRTITIDNKFEGVVSIDVWTGYAINVIRKDGTRKVVIGPCTYLMEYDETLEILEMSTGKPKTTDHLIRTVYLRVDNNKIGDIINVETKDFVNVGIKVSYCVNFDRNAKDKWFSIENYVKYLCDRVRSLLKREAKKYTIDEFYQNSTDIIRRVVLNLPDPNAETASTDREFGRRFPENGMVISDVEVLSVHPDEEVADILESHQSEMIRNAIELSDASQREAVAKKLAESTKTIANIEHESEMYRLELETRAARKRAEQAKIKAKLDSDNKMAELQSTQAQQTVLDSINDSELARQKLLTDSEVDRDTRFAQIEESRRKAYAEAVKTMLSGISPQLAASIEQLSMTSNMADIAQALSPLAIVGDTSIADVANKLLKGTALEDILEKLTDKGDPDQGVD
ncbi:MAG: SPFH domain-containing protein [Lachnospiraceae bacterium]|nr:SPFH domain-containing protein [Lachnospiraceae bacterium]